MSEKIIHFKEFMQDPKKRAILSLSIYFVFFLVIIIAIRLNPIKRTLPKTSIEKWGLQNEYNFIYTFSSKEQTLILNGNFKEGESFFEIEDRKYKTENQKFYLEDSMEEYQFEDAFIKSVFFDINAKKISDWIKRGMLEYTSTYSDGTLKKNYQIPKKEFNKEKTDTTDMFSLAIYERENTLIKIEIEFQELKESNKYYKVQMEIMDKR